MNNKHKHRGFSLTEVLIAVGILSVGMVFVAGVFPAGIYLMTIATERTIAAVAADEAFAKIQIYALGDLSIAIDDVNLAGMQTNTMTDFNDTTVFPAVAGINHDEFEYSSAKMSEPNQYCWFALCRRAAPEPNRLVQITVFVCRKLSPNLQYFRPDPNGEFDWLKSPPDTNDWPRPVKVSISAIGNDELTITDVNDNEYLFISDGYTIVDDATGRIYRVLERYKDDPGTATREDSIILLERKWEGSPAGYVWVIPAPISLMPGDTPVPRGRCPCIAVYQKEIRF